MADIRSEAELRKVLEGNLEKAINRTAEKILKIFQDKYIMKYAYYNQGDNKMYHDKTGEPTYEFYKAWNWTQLRKQLNSIVTELWYDSSGVNYNRDTFRHGSKYSRPNDISDNLPAILEGKQSSLWMSVSRKGKFWELFISEMFDGGTLEKILASEIRSAGLNVTKI